MYRIIIIGAGELGSRHLQGVLKLQMPVTIEVVDPSPASLQRTRARAEEIAPNPNIKQVSYLSSIPELSQHTIDICIVATNSNLRLQVLEELMAARTVRNLILEKILFQRIADYDRFQQILDNNKTNAWVNCSKRTVSVYKEIKTNIQPGEKLMLTAIGGNWGLACNAIHYIDTLSFLNGDESFTFNTEGLREIIPSKRPGFSELPGTLTGKQSNGSEFLIHAASSGTADISFQLMSDNFFWQVNEAQGIFSTASSAKAWVPEVQKFRMPYQSELTTDLCEDILVNNHCGLPSYEVSSRLHQSLIKAFLEVFNRDTENKTDTCPIT